MNKRFLIVALGLVGCDGGHAASPDPDASTVDAPPGDVTVYDVTTSKGAFVLETHHSWSPHGVDRFRALVEAGFYNDARFFRVLSGFVAQFGINGTPATDAMWNHMTIPDDPVVASNTRGFVTFAQTSQANSRTTQLFVNYADNSQLDAMRFAPFAQVTSGMDVVDNFDAEYGEQPSQSQITSQGNAYLTTNFPNLDYIIAVTPR